MAGSRSVVDGGDAKTSGEGCQNLATKCEQTPYCKLAPISQLQNGVLGRLSGNFRLASRGFSNPGP